MNSILSFVKISAFKTGLGCLVFFWIPVMAISQNIPKKYIAYHVSDSITIDGEGIETAWQNADRTDDFIDIEGEKIPKFQTHVKMLWDENYLYFYAELKESHIWADIEERDAVIFYNNDFEIFMDPDGDTQSYMEFEMNALNTVWDLLLVKAYREGGHAVDSWDIKGIKTAVKINGSLNDPTNEDTSWVVEIAMPWEVLTENSISGKIPKNEFWRINFSRVNWDFELKDGKYSRKKDESGKFLPEYNWVWSPQGVINMHEPEHWGYVYFSDKSPGQLDTFQIPDGEFIRWKMYEIYRKQKAFKSETGSFARNLQQIDSERLEVKGRILAPSIEFHRAGWNVIIKSPFSQKTLIINQAGNFSILK